MIESRALLVFALVLSVLAVGGSSADAKRASESKPAVRNITFDTIKFEMKKGDPFVRKLLTPAINKLDGKTVRLPGYILPSFQQKGISKFVLVRDNMECCFGPGAALYDCVVVDMVDGATTDFSVRPVSVQGVFTIRELVLGGKHLAIYHLDGIEVDIP